MAKIKDQRTNISPIRSLYFSNGYVLQISQLDGHNSFLSQFKNFNSRGPPKEPYNTVVRPSSMPLLNDFFCWKVVVYRNSEYKARVATPREAERLITYIFTEISWNTGTGPAILYSPQLCTLSHRQQSEIVTIAWIHHYVRLWRINTHVKTNSVDRRQPISVTKKLKCKHIPFWRDLKWLKTHRSINHLSDLPISCNPPFQTAPWKRSPVWCLWEGWRVWGCIENPWYWRRTSKNRQQNHNRTFSENVQRKKSSFSAKISSGWYYLTPKMFKACFEQNCVGAK